MGWQGFFTSSCTKGPGLSFGSRYRQNTPFRIALEAHHSLGDGTGGMCVLQTLTATYLRLKGHSEIENRRSSLFGHSWGVPDPADGAREVSYYSN